MSIPAEVQGQMGRGCRAAPQQREPPRAAIRHGGDAEPGKLGGETQSVMLYPSALRGHYHGIRVLRIPSQTNTSNKVSHSMQGLKIENL